MNKLSREEKKRITEKWGVLTVPKGETSRAKKIRANALAFKSSQTEMITKSLEIWFKAHPNASREEIALRLERNELALGHIHDNTVNKARIAAKKWDWREHSIDVGPVMNQGLRCNTCWAFAAVSAAHASLQKNYHDLENMWSYAVSEKGELIGFKGANDLPAGDPSPFV